MKNKFDGHVENLEGEINIGDTYYLVLHPKDTPLDLTNFTKKNIQLTKEQFEQILDPENRRNKELLLLDFMDKFKEFNLKKRTIIEITNLFYNFNDLELFSHFLKEFKIVSIEEFKTFAKEVSEYLINETQNNEIHLINLSDNGSSDQEVSINFVSFINLFLSNSNSTTIEKIKILSFGKSLFQIKNNVTVLFFIPFIYNWEKLDKRIENYLKRTQDKGISITQLSIVSLGALKTEKEKIEDKYQVDVLHWLDKGITNFYFEEELKEKLNTMKKIEDILSQGKNRGDIYPLGYNNSESLIVIKNHGVPKNVFPIFWCGKNFDNLFNPFFS